MFMQMKILVDNVSTAESRSGFVICFAKVSIMWISNFQAQIALSLIEVEYMALSSALREVFSLTELVHEMRQQQMVQLPNNVKV